MTVVDTDKMYTIGEAAEMCNVSRKTLRFYEKIGLLIPDYVCPSNGYRYYSKDTVMLIPILKYYKQMGFHLQEMCGVGDTLDYFYHQRNFLSKLNELKKEEEYIQNCYESISDWMSIINEGNAVIENQQCSVNVKYIDQESYYSMEQEFEYDYKSSIINIPWINYLEGGDSEITGPVILGFNDYKLKAAGMIKTATITQKPVRNSQYYLPRTNFGGQMFLCMYHVGEHDAISSRYHIIEDWAKEHHYKIGPNCYERYVIDFWATQDVSKFVTEIMIPAEKL